MKLGVVLFDAFAFLEGAACGAYAKTEIPEGPGKVGNQRAKFTFGFFVTEEEEDIKIGVREKQSAPVTAERHKGKSLGLRVMNAENFPKNLLGGFVGESAKRLQRILRASACFKLSPNALSFVFGLWSEDGQRS
jgi:hypothetical protein